MSVSPVSDRARNSESTSIGLGKEDIGGIPGEAQSVPNTWRNLILVHGLPDAADTGAIIGDFLGGLAGHLGLAATSALVGRGALEQREH
jgi:hypothetical protein